MKKNCIILTVGLPRSGKSTWSMNQGCPVVNPDSIRLALHGQPFIQEAEGLVWETAYLMTKSLLIAGHYRVIVDATNINSEARDKWRDRFPDSEVICRYFETPKEVCIERAIKNGREYLLPIIERMAKEIDFL